MSEGASKLLWQIYSPLIWVVIAGCFAIGVLGILSPGAFKGALNRLNRGKRIRILGVAFMVLGATMFANAEMAKFEILLKSVGVVLFLYGGVSLFLPAMVVVVVELITSKGPLVHRALGVAFLGMTYLFFVASQAAEPITDVIQGIVETTGGSSAAKE